MGEGAGAKVWGWYKAGEAWVKIQVDLNGKLVIVAG